MVGLVLLGNLLAGPISSDLGWYLPFYSEGDASIFVLVGFAIQPHISKTWSRAFMEGFVTSQRMNSAQKNPGIDMSQMTSSIEQKFPKRTLSL